MSDINTLLFELQRRTVLFKSSTAMPDGSLLGYNNNPNLAASGVSAGEDLIYNCPQGSRYQEDSGKQWYKKESPNTWEEFGGGDTFVTSQILSYDNMEKGHIAQITVDMLDTSAKVVNYKNSNTSDVHYIRIFNQNIEFVEAVTDGLSTEQLVTRDNVPIYWTDVTESVITLEVTAYPVTIYSYTEYVKMKLCFEEMNALQTPVLKLGVGDGLGNNVGYIYKDNDGIAIKYIKADGSEKYIKFGEDGTLIEGTNATDMQIYNNGMIITYDDGSIKDFDTVKDTEDRITQLINNTDGITTNITYHTTDKPL